MSISRGDLKILDNLLTRARNWARRRTVLFDHTCGIPTTSEPCAIADVLANLDRALRNTAE